MPKFFKNTLTTPLLPRTIMKAKAKGTPEKLLIMVFKEKEIYIFLMELKQIKNSSPKALLKVQKY